MTTKQTTFNNKTTFKFKVGDDLQVINKVISVLGLAPSDYTYNAKEGTIITDKITKESIQEQVKALGFDFLLGNGDTSDKNYKTETVTVKRSYDVQRSFNDAYELVISALYKDYKQVLGLVETKIDYVAKTVTVTANVRIPTFNDLDYKVALILTNFSYVNNSSTNTFVKDLIEELSQESKDRNEVYRLLNEAKAEFDKVAPNEVKAFIKLFTY